MTSINIVKLLLYMGVIVALTPILGLYMKKVFAGERTFLDPVLKPVERLIYRICGVDADRDQGWVEWTVVMLVVNGASLVILYLLQRLQNVLPLNPNHFSPVSADSSWNTAVSFTTNTNWQGYSGETTMSHFTQMFGLALHNFLSAATGIAIAVAVIRGVAREKASGIGNFWFDCTRAILWVLLPISFVAALFLVSRGVVQNFQADVAVKTVEGAEQKIPQGPVASQEAIKMLGVNGGGFFNANSAHPFENPTPLTNLLEMLAVFSIPAGLTYAFGR
ncbi:MAG TPA: potassium-transporting ATPase subunit KdpA, partial [Thermoanaerobaculia bacterium]|nr:potassium-transporting ATPase subunit KdpA [Thermoanaerobaculia bacterium]